MDALGTSCSASLRTSGARGHYSREQFRTHSQYLHKRQKEKQEGQWDLRTQTNQTRPGGSWRGHHDPTNPALTKARSKPHRVEGYLGQPPVPDLPDQRALKRATRGADQN